MITLAILLAFGAAFMHAGWNALLKASKDHVMMMAVISTVQGICGLAILFFAPPLNQQIIPILLLSILVHYLYKFLLLRAYAKGGLSEVYTLARGISPALVALGGWVLVGEKGTPLSWLGIFIVSCGLLSLTFSHKKLQLDRSVLIFSLATGTMIASYSILDGLGVRASHTPLSFIGWLFLSDLMVLPVCCYFSNNSMLRLKKTFVPKNIIASMMSPIAYTMVLYAVTLAPFATISAIRESSILIAASIGVLILGERPWQRKLTAAFIVSIGIVMITLYHR